MKVDKDTFSKPKSGVQNLVVTHYDCPLKQITNMQFYKLNKIGDCKVKPADFHILPAQVETFSQNWTLHLHAYAIHAKLSDKESFYHKNSLNGGFRLDHDYLYVNNMERFCFPTEIEARRELSLLVLLSKHYYQPQIIQVDVLRDTCCKANIEAKKGRFQLNRKTLRFPTRKHDL